MCDQEENVNMDEYYQLLGKELSSLVPMGQKGLVKTLNWVLVKLSFMNNSELSKQKNTSFYQSSICNNEQRLQITNKATYRIRSVLDPVFYWHKSNFMSNFCSKSLDSSVSLCLSSLPLLASIQNASVFVSHSLPKSHLNLTSSTSSSIC